MCFGSMNALLFLLRDVFESLKCWLDLWLSSLFVAFISMCFSSLWKTTFYQARQILDSFLSIEPFKLLFSTEVNAISIHQDFWSSSQQISIASSIHQETFCLADRSSTDSQSIEVGICSIAAWQLLDLSGPSCMHCFFFFTCFASFYYLAIHSILFHYIHAFIWIPCAPWSSLCFLSEAL